MDLRIPQGKPGEDGDDGDDGISPTLRLTEQGIEVSYDKGSTWSLLVPISEFHITNNITNEYINNPDEEDITVIDDKLKFKDKEYNLSEFSGLGRTYLRKNIIGSKNVLTKICLIVPVLSIIFNIIMIWMAKLLLFQVIVFFCLRVVVFIMVLL
jgi:hypothetical protein